MSINKIISLANLFNKKYQLLKTADQVYDWSETIRQTMEGQALDRELRHSEPVPIPAISTKIEPQKVELVKAKPAKQLAPDILNKLKNIRNELPHLMQVAGPNFNSQLKTIDQKSALILNRYESKKTLNDQEVSSVNNLYQNLHTIKSGIISAKA